jgi:hypothetical protein
MKTSASDRLRAGRMIQAVNEGDQHALAVELAAFREEILSCGSVRTEREFDVRRVKERR